MKFFVAIKSNADTEAGKMPSEQLLREMTEFNEKLVKAGVMLAGEGLHPSSRGARVEFSGKSGRRVIDGPFAESKELVAGYWIFNCASLQEAIDWVKQVPNPDGDDGVVEIRQIFDAADFGEEFTPDLRERNDRMADEIAKKAK
ncbi:MAG TPA: YciI family protein [Rhizobiaceae bacterium]|nr:YciI family protein [Rhizobiaceae bacterium]